MSRRKNEPSGGGMNSRIDSAAAEGGGEGTASFREMAQFRVRGSKRAGLSAESFEKIPSDTIGTLAAGDQECSTPFPRSFGPSLPATWARHHHRRRVRRHHLRQVELAVFTVARGSRRRVDLKPDGLKGVFPLSGADGLSDKSIYVPANEG